MSLDKSAFIENYLAELQENVKQIDASIIILKKDPENEEELVVLLRALHTIKGSSRMMKFPTMERIAHGLETVFKGVKERRYPIGSPIVQLVFCSTDFLNAGAQAIKARGEDQLPVDELLSVFDRVYAGEPFSLESIQTSVPRQGGQGEKGNGAPTERSIGEESIRIDVRRIDGTIRLLNNLIIRQFQLKKQSDAIAELDRQLQEIGDGLRDRQPVGESQGKVAACSHHVRNLQKSFMDEMIQLEEGAFELQGQIMSLRMLPIELVLGTLGRMVEETAIKQGKEVVFVIRGADTLVDKLVLESIHDPIIHIVRNSVDHGVEPPSERERAGKPRAAKITVSCASEGGNVVVRVKDDGKGVDYDKVRARVVQLYPHLSEEVERMDEGALNAFLFRPGFSTREEVTELSGRGIGLDIVRANVEKIKGKISLSSEKGKGTEIVLSLPFSLATVQGFFVSSAHEKFLVPAGFVKEILVARQLEQVDLPDRKAVKLRDKIIPLFTLSEIIHKDDETAGDGRFVLIVESLGEWAGVVVDNVQQFSSLVYKPLPSNLSGLKAVQGIVFDESLNMVNVLFVPEVVNRFKRMKSIDTKKKFAPRQREYRHILVVDDSLTTREIEKSILELEDYNVETAVDGIDALEKARERYFHLIVTDVHMPRMDGCTFVENLRKDDRYRNTPVIVISAVEDKETRGRFEPLRVSSYVFKSEFDRGNLVSEVHRLIG